MPWPAFADGTDKGNTRATPAARTQYAKFADTSDNIVAEVVKLNAAAKTGDLDQIKVAFRAAAGTCQSVP